MQGRFGDEAGVVLTVDYSPEWFIDKIEGQA